MRAWPSPAPPGRCSRGVIRAHVADLPEVTLIAGRSVDELTAIDDRVRITGVRLAVEPETPNETLAADLVVDATGRRSSSPQWLQRLGYDAPDEERMQVGVHYSTRLFRRHPSDLDGCRHVAIAARPGERRGGLALAVEDDRWLVTLVGVVGERPPTELEDFVAYAAGLWRSDLREIIDGAEPVSEAVTGGFPAHLRRRYDHLRRFPERYVVTGDAVCSLSPIYGQGMTVAIREAQVLGEVLDRHGLDHVGKRCFRQGRSVVDTAWTLATSADLADPGVEGRRTLGWRALQRYVNRAMRAATQDSVVADALLAVNALVAPHDVRAAGPAPAARGPDRRRHRRRPPSFAVVVTPRSGARGTAARPRRHPRGAGEGLWIPPAHNPGREPPGGPRYRRFSMRPSVGGGAHGSQPATNWIRFPQVSSKTAVVTGPIAVGGCVNVTPALTSRSCSAWTSSTAKDASGIPSAASASR